MAIYKLSTQAYNDLVKIADYTIDKWGINQSRIYRDKLYNCFTTLANYPTIGRDASEYKPKLMQYPFEGHAVFYQTIDVDILIIRVLGNRMDYKQHI